MMLHVTNGNGKLCSVFRRQVIGMHVAGDSVNPGVVELRQISRRSNESSVGLLRFQITDMLADKNVRADAQRDGILQMRAESED
jgi:hypothetical protein